MSKLAMIKAYQRNPRMAGDFFSKVLGLGKKLLGGAKKIGAKLPSLVEQGVDTVTGIVDSASSGGGGGGTRRRRRGITARELSGYRKVANLLHKEGMVSRRSRGRK